MLNLCAELSPMFKEPVKSTDLSLENKICISRSETLLRGQLGFLKHVSAVCQCIESYTVNACVILHICNRAQFPVPEQTVAEVHQEAQMQHNYVDVGDGSQHNLQQDTSTKARLIHRLWAAWET